MIKLVLLTGFLGAGKTTLLQRILDCYREHKVGVIINDFGKINIDAMLIKRNGVEMAELSNGSIFCACIKENFLDSLIEMSGRDIEFLFIEASGLADPANFGDILPVIGTKVNRPYDYLGSICIVDAGNFLELQEVLPGLSNQLEYSSAAIINKADLADEQVIFAISAIIAGLNPTAKIYVTAHCGVDVGNVVDNLSGSVAAAARDTSNTPESRPKSFLLTAEQVVSYEKLKALIDEVAPFAYRVKGFAVTDQGAVEISAVGKTVTFKPWPEIVRRTEIVVISSVGIKMMSVMTSAIARYLQGELSVGGMMAADLTKASSFTGWIFVHGKSLSLLQFSDNCDIIKASYNMN